jgi:hypothetical protein
MTKNGDDYYISATAEDRRRVIFSSSLPSSGLIRGLFFKNLVLIGNFNGQQAFALG